METMLEEGRLYKVDARLRPSGEQGLLVTSWTSFERYHRDEAADWERVAVMRARTMFSNEEPAVRAQRDATLQRIAFDSELKRARFVADLRRVRGRVTTERGRVPPGSRHLKLDAGGLMDVELLVALGQLESASDAALRTTVTARALARLTELGWPAALADDYAGLRRVALRLRLLRDRPEDIVSPRDLPVLARSLGTTADALAAELDERMSRIRTTFDERFA
jgi:glutamate-ammonia-ligase adenylyltransferase